MLYVNILEDDNLQEVLSQIISGLLPTPNYLAEYHTDILTNVLDLIHLDEMSGEYYVMFSLLVEINKIRLKSETKKNLITKQAVESALTNNVYTLVRQDEVRMQEIMLSEGYGCNFDIETDVLNACKLLSKRTMSLYDKCFNMRMRSDEVVSLLPTLKEALLANVAETSLQVQATILNAEMKIGRNKYIGSKGWLDFITSQQTEISKRLESLDEGTIVIDSIDKAEELLNSLEDLYQPLADYDLPPLDDETPMLRHRLVVICADENTGKTRFAINCVGNLLMQNKKVVFMCGENTQSLTLADFLSNYIYKKYGLRLTSKMIAQKNSLPEDKQKLINLATAEIATGKLILVSAFSYDTLYNDLQALYEREKFDAVFIDHSLALKGNGTIFDNITQLAIQTRNFKKDFPVYIQVLSHFSTTAKEALAKGKPIESSPTKGNAILSAEADDIFLLIKNEMLDKQNLLAIFNYKRRNAAKVLQHMIVRKKFDVSSFYYDSALQNSIDGIDLTAEQALLDIDKYHNSNDEEDNETELDGGNNTDSWFEDYEDEDEDDEYEDEDGDDDEIYID